MSDRKSLVTTLWVASTLVLLASILAAPIWSTVPVVQSSETAGLSRHFALSPILPATRLKAAQPSDPVGRVNALPFEDEEQDRVDVLERPCVAFPNPSPTRKVAQRRPIALCEVASFYPIRT